MKRQTALIALLIFLICLQLPSQTSQPPVAMPKSPNQYMQQAISLNGLAADGLQPWHIKASYSYFNEAGAVADSGIIEEWRISSHLYKVSLAGQRYSQTQYLSGNGLRITGDQNPPSWNLQTIEKYIHHPLPTQNFLQRGEFERSALKFGQLSLDCIRSTSGGIPDFPAWCFSKDKPAIRVIGDADGSETVFDEVAKVGGQYLAKQVSWVRQGKPLLEMKIDTMEYPAQLQEKDVQTPPDAILPGKIALSDEMPPLKKVHNQAPEYPINAKAAGIQGQVRISATITEDGSVDEVSIISGPKELQVAALNAVKKWRYEPYLLDGRPVRVATQFGIWFTMGRR